MRRRSLLIVLPLLANACLTPVEDRCEGVPSRCFRTFDAGGTLLDASTPGADAGRDGGAGQDGGIPECGSSNCGGCCAGKQCMETLRDQSAAACGAGGATCRACGSIETCWRGECRTVADAHVGDGCATDFDCAKLGPTAVCRHTTSEGDGIYDGGYCTARCLFAGRGTGCPSGSICLRQFNRGERDHLCIKTCSSAQECRSPGYTCHMFGAERICWLDPLPQFRPATPPPPGGGVPAGSSCASDTDCVPPDAQHCLPEVLGAATGFTAGYCTHYCGPSSICVTGGVCTERPIAVGVSAFICMAPCASPGTGQSTCRPGYVCTATTDGGACQPRCSNGAYASCFSSGAPKTCNAATGYCE